MTSRLLMVCALLAMLSIAGSQARAADEIAPHRKPVKEIADQRLDVAPGARLALFATGDINAQQPGITRAIIVVHGRLRDAAVYFATALEARQAAGSAGAVSMMIAPQLLAEVDWAGNQVAPDVLRWSLEGWQGGDDAIGPVPFSSFAALDAILLRLADRARFPELSEVVVAGHSGGGQVVQRYAILSRSESAVRAAGIGIRYVVANPSSYAYFTSDRPAPTTGCDGFNRWKYGMDGLPRYAGGASPALLEETYVKRPVIYLLGGRDTDPQHPALDKTCMAQSQGPFRLARGQAYVADLRSRHRDLKHYVRVIDGVGHDGRAMFTSACGLAALFDTPGCTSPGLTVDVSR